MRSSTHRYATAAAIATSVFPAATGVFLTTGAGFADALSGGPVAGSAGQPLLLSTLNCLPAPTAAVVATDAPATVNLLGGTGVLGAGVESLTSCAASTLPAPVVTPPATVAYVAPTVTFTSSSCKETSSAWDITWNWTATGGHYVDLGSVQHPTNVVVNGGTRTWAFTTTEAGWDGSKPPAPTASDAFLSSLVAPIGHTGAMDWISITRTINQVPVQCG